MPVETQQTQSQPEEVQPPIDGVSTPQETTDLPPVSPILPEETPVIVAAELPIEDLGLTPEPPTEEGKLLSIPTGAMKALKAKEREKGRQEAATQYDAKLSALTRIFGFANWEALENADPEEFWKAKQGQSRSVEDSRAVPAPKPEMENTLSEEEDTDRIAHPRKYKQLQRDNDRLLENTKRLNRARAHAERGRKKAEDALASSAAETEIRIEAGRAGVRDIDYAVHSLRKHLKSKTPEELTAFQSSEYFSKTLRESAPHLYATESRPATTAPSAQQEASGASSGGAPRQGEGTEAAKGGLDATKLSHQEFQKLLADRGLSNPSVGIPS